MNQQNSNVIEPRADEDSVGGKNLSLKNSSVTTISRNDQIASIGDSEEPPGNVPVIIKRLSFPEVIERCDDGKISNRKSSSASKRSLRNKVFVPRNSLLTDLCEDQNFRTLYHIFIVALLIVLFYTIVYDFVEGGSIKFGLGPIVAGFAKFHYSLILWCMMLLCTLCAYLLFKCWIVIHRKLKTDLLRTTWNIVGLFNFLLYQGSFLVLTLLAVAWLDTPPASSVAVLIEMTRFVMKFFAFVRSNVCRALDVGSCDTILLPSFNRYIYFLFVPPLVYSDEYPRTERIRWAVVGKHVFEVIGVIFYISFLLERFLNPTFYNFGKEDISLGHLILSIFRSIIPAFLICVFLFYCMLHSWMNVVSELLRFADRMFYRDWWNASSFAEYIRSWNVIVHDWLYTYIYKDLVEYCMGNCRFLATIAVFTLSAIFHEIILAFTFRFFYPVMFVQFEFMGLLLMLLTKNVRKAYGNVLLWFLLCIGSGILLSLFSMEFYSRRNCPVSDESLVDYMIPVSWFCNGISVNLNWTITSVLSSS
ncbi:sterol O-acyltransferase 1-like [Uranotaenia lowii]|uniref:sterol O-acyltransferase 1-like n=1 Tax=Uranotaenia lowii TaxID=190385 RepID=UPI00247A0C74|nr:sterol O-acyltransferase 1-like [Uranotaenia lowii]